MSLLSAERIARLSPVSRLRSIGGNALQQFTDSTTRDAEEPLLSKDAVEALHDLQKRMETGDNKHTSQSEVWFAINNWSAARDDASYDLAVYTISRFRGSYANKTLLYALHISRSKNMAFTDAQDEAMKVDALALDEVWFSYNPIMNHASTAE